MINMKALPVTFFLVCACAMVLEISGMSIDEIIAGANEDVDNFDFMDATGDYLTHELDMRMSKEQYSMMMGEDTTSGRKKRKAIRPLQMRWPDKKVYYKMNEEAFTTAHKAVIDEAIAEWQKFTCLTFEKAGSQQEDFAYFDNARGCYSYVGKIGRSQTIGLATGCRVKGIVVHEIGHAIGFYHEQNRPDRDDHVTIHMDNVPSSVQGNFRKYSTQAVNNYGVPYDLGSVMHYGSYAFSNNGRKTIVTKDQNRQNEIGNRRGLSYYDIMLANKMYECSKHCSKTCPKNSYLDKNCVCQCKNEGEGDPTRPCDDTDGGSGTVRTTTPRTTRTPMTTTPQPCADKNKYCSNWANSEYNYCQTNTYVKTYCKQSCNTCEGEGEVERPVCVDNKDSCSAWKDLGLCDGVYESYMKTHCRKSCDYCKSGTTGEQEGNNGDMGPDSGSNRMDPGMLFIFTTAMFAFFKSM